MKLPILDAVVQAIRPKMPKLEHTIFVCVQHLLYTTVDLFESLILLGAMPENIFLLGKQYSSCAAVIDQLRTMGIQVQTPTLLKSLGEYEIVFNKEVFQVWDNVRNFIRNSSHSIESIVVLDDGGRCLAAIPQDLLKTFCVVGIEQTTAGIAHLSRELNYIDIATSTTKKLEANMVAKVVLNKLLHVLLPPPEDNPAIGVVGIGCIGGAIVKKLVCLGYRPFLYDFHQDKKSLELSFEDQGIRWIENVDQFLESADYIFGCTGKDFMASLNIEKCIKGRKHFISCSSEDKEFLSILQKIQSTDPSNCYNPLKDIEWQMNPDTLIHLVRGGFPCNFDESGTSVPAKEIQLTRALILGGLVQAIIIAPSYKRNHLQGRVMLDPTMQQFIVSKWMDLNAPHKADVPLSESLEMFMHKSWIIKNSGGVFHSLPEFSDCFDIKKGDLSHADHLLNSSNIESHVISLSAEDLVASVPGSLYWKNKAGVYLGCNDFMVQKAGLERRTDIIGKTDWELWPNQAEKIRENDLRVIETGKLITTEETVGKRVFFSMKNPLRDKDSNIIGIICNSHDISYLKEIEVELREAKNQSEASNQAKMQFLATVSHELRSPITSILGMVHFLRYQENITQAQQGLYIENIDISGKHLLSLVNDFLDFSKLEAGKLEIKVEELDLKGLMTEVTTILMPEAMAKGLEFMVDYAPDMPDSIVADARALKQIMINLINNAIKFTEKGSVKFKVACIEQSMDSVKLSFSVSDTGIGISQDHLKIIFDRFQQVDASYSRQYGGTGLGLSISKKLIEMMHGTIEVFSEPLQGSMFECKITFEKVKREAPSLPLSPIRDEKPAPELKHAVAVEEKTRALLIDDEPLIRLIHSTFLKNLDCAVDTVENAEEALKKLVPDHPYDIIFSDMGLPGMSGPDLIKLYRQQEKHAHRHVPIIGLTGYGSPEDRAIFLKAGVDAVLVKPVNTKQLQDALENYVLEKEAVA